MENKMNTLEDLVRIIRILRSEKRLSVGQGADACIHPHGYAGGGLRGGGCD